MTGKLRWLSRHRVTFAILAASTVACAGRPAPSSASIPAVPPQFDHLIVAIDTLSRGIAILRELTGVTPVAVGRGLLPGYGAEPGRGMQSAILSLGADTYLELVAPEPNGPAAPQLVAMFARYRTPTPLGWAVRTSNVDSVASAIVSRGIKSLPVRPGARVRATKDTVRWRSLHFWHNVTTIAPFFIQWEKPSDHLPSHMPLGCSLDGLTLYFPAADSLSALLDAAGVRTAVSVGRGRNAGIRALLDCPTGRLQIPAVAP